MDGSGHLWWARAMSAPERRASGVGSLSDKELEILRLLTAGHTVKSIAARLGRSEASINERLRDARRKTGVGSSRELARHVAAQKIWDKNIELSTHRSVVDHGARSLIPGRPASKGSIIMLFAMAIATAGLVFAAAESIDQAPTAQAAAVAAPGHLPLVGRWALDTTRLPPDGRPRSVTLDFRVSDDQVWTGRSDIVAADGSRQHAQATGPADGVPVPVAGNMAFADRVSMRQPAPNTLVLTFTKDGAPVSTRVYTVEDDGNSMKETIVWAHDVTPRRVTTYFNRAD
jgi:DNA-binding CsgD family transcriptional regulator